MSEAERETRLRAWASAIRSALEGGDEISLQELSARYELDAKTMEKIVKEVLTKGYLQASFEGGVLRPAAPEAPPPKAPPTAPVSLEDWARAVRSALKGKEELTLYELSLAFRVDSKRMEKIVRELLGKGLLPEMTLDRGSVKTLKGVRRR